MKKEKVPIQIFKKASTKVYLTAFFFFFPWSPSEKILNQKWTSNSSQLSYAIVCSHNN